MKRERNLTLAIISCVIALSLRPGAAQVPPNGAAKVVRLKGSARYSTGNFVWHEIKVGDVLRPGTVVQTSADQGSYIDLALGDGKAAVAQPMIYRPMIPSSFNDSTMTFQPTAEQNVVRLWRDGALGIDKLGTIETGSDVVTDTQLDLKHGRITANVKKLSAASKYEVKFPNGVAGVRGTVFDMQAVGIVKVYIGSMVVAWVDPKNQNVTTQTVVGGQAYDVSDNRVSLLSMDSMNELGEAASALVVMQPYPTTTTMAIDRTMIGMSPVGANPASIPAPSGSSGEESSGVTTTYNFPPPPVGGH